MPTAPSLPPEMMQQSAGAPSATNLLMAAADLHANGELGDAAAGRSMPQGQKTPKVGFPAPHRRNPRHTKSPLG